ncbi:SpoIIE family protein phosphatase [Nonomuraea aridisoli]|uniref:ANTAR domain-containing protein n=1 Tax=Nonomuraea aridisoli TaxID=2070368 RepID=A0A2W2G1G7_9ACTN|nr:SpoIIE family protein phosphatase [Nonomuraea aridisoli]PZG20724.1 hypothetical protein C1J01_08630 [Nonomuraea aridisoli]
MTEYAPLSRYETGAASARIREQLARLRQHMRGEAIVAEATARLAIRRNIRPAEAAQELARTAQHSGLALVDVARVVEPPQEEAETPPEPPGWLRGVLDTAHVSMAYLTPVRDATARIVDFRVLAANENATTVAGMKGSDVAGRRLLAISPGAAAGLLDACIRVYETGEPFSREPLEYVEVMDSVLWPATMSLRVAKIDDGVLTTWRLLDEEELLVSGWERAQRLAEFGWAEWNLASDHTWWTPQMYEMFGRDRSEGPMALEDLPAAVIPDDVPLVEEQLRSLLEFREAVETEYRVLHRHGVRHLSMFSEPILDTNGVPIKVRCLAQDVTRNRRKERALAVAHQQAHRQRERAEEEHRVTVQLQNTILPVRHGIVHLPGLTAAVRYLPGEDLWRLGGDWFKLRQIPDGRVLVAIGDAMGHGLTAASVMLQTRAGLAGLAYTGAPPSRLATWLNDLVVNSAESVTVTSTAVIGHFDPESRTLCWTNAGHPAPILLRDGRAELVEGRSGIMLGAFDATEYGMSTLQLRPCDTLLLYTDGIVERRGADYGAGLDALLEAIRSCDHGEHEDPEELIDCLLRLLDVETAEDDICLVALRVL